MIEKYVNTEELKRLLSSLAVILTALTVAGLFASIVVPGLRNANKPETPMPVNPVMGEPGWLDPTGFPPERGKVIPPVDPMTLMEPSPQLVAKGKELFQKNCASCHGTSGHGDGQAAASINPRPRDFTGPTGWVNGTDLPAVFKTITSGIKGSSMSSFDYLPKKDRMALAHYVQSLGSFSHGSGSREVIDALAKDLAAAGETTPNKIPVSAAMAKLEQEFNEIAPLTISADDQGAGAEILRRVVIDQARAARVLSDSALWRTGPKELAASILPGLPGNGFAVSTATLSAAEWQWLHAALAKNMLLDPQRTKK
jgi:mono/diheme cytochrome c family protein